MKEQLKLRRSIRLFSSAPMKNIITVFLVFKKRIFVTCDYFVAFGVLIYFPQSNERSAGTIKLVGFYKDVARNNMELLLV